MDHFRVKVARLVVKLAQDKTAGGLLARLEAGAARHGSSFGAAAAPKVAPKVAPKLGPYSGSNRYFAEKYKNNPELLRSAITI